MMEYNNEEAKILLPEDIIQLEKGAIHPFVEVYRPLEQPQSMG